MLALMLIPLLAWTVLRRQATADTVLVWGLALVLHGSLLVTSAVEAGHIRYTVALHVLDVTLLFWLLMRLLPRRLPLGAARPPGWRRLFMTLRLGLLLTVLVIGTAALSPLLGVPVYGRNFAHDANFALTALHFMDAGIREGRWWPRWVMETNFGLGG